MSFSPNQLAILQWLDRDGPVYKNAVPPRECQGADMTNARGLITRGYLLERGGRIEITDLGRDALKHYRHCPACSTVVKTKLGREGYLEKHKCEHGLWCTPGNVDEYTREISRPLGTSDRSQHCEKCNRLTEAMMRGCFGLRMNR